MDTCEKARFNKMLNDEYLIPKFIDLQSDYYINATKAVEATEDLNALVASIIFNNH